VKLDAALDLLSREPDAALDVAELALHLARDEYPELDVPAYLRRLDHWAAEVRPTLGGKSLKADVESLSRYLFLGCGFHGNTENYYDRRNSYLNDVMDRRTGIPITLSVVAMAVGNRAGLTVQGVGMPGHFIARAVRRDEVIWFDPFHGGQVLSIGDCERLILQATNQSTRVTPDMLAPIPLHLLVVRMLSNLRRIYLDREDDRRGARVLGRLVQLLPDNAAIERDLGLCLFRTGQHGQALDHLEAALRVANDESDADLIKKWIAGTKRELARWN
jgi:regulator of sirC expression with transglutaminase-like and TPR domain